MPRIRPYLHAVRLQKVMEEYLLSLGSAVCTIFFYLQCNIGTPTMQRSLSCRFSHVLFILSDTVQWVKG